MVPSKRKGYATKCLKMRIRKQERAAFPVVSVYPGTGTVLMKKSEAVIDTHRARAGVAAFKEL